MTDKILMVKYVNIDGIEYADFKINGVDWHLINHSNGWELADWYEDDPVYVRCKDDMIAIINSEKKMKFLLGA